MPTGPAMVELARQHIGEEYQKPHLTSNSISVSVEVSTFIWLHGITRAGGLISKCA